MANTRTFNRSFSGGELSPEMFGRIDDAKFQTGAALMQNFIATPQGPARNRAGLAYVRNTKNNGVARLIPFVYNNTQTMVIELGNEYIRFHTQGQTLLYSETGVEPWIAPSGAISLSFTTPTVVTWTGHGLTSGDPIQFYIYGGYLPSQLPAGLQVGYTYTVEVVDANNFNILDNGTPVGLVGGGSSGGTNFPGTGTASASVACAPHQLQTDTSSILSGLANTPIAGGLATVSFTYESTVFASGGFANINYQYSTGSGWNVLYTSTDTESNTLSFQIPLTNLDLLQLQVSVTGRALPGGSVSATGEITAWSVTVPSAGGSALTMVRAYRYYSAGDMTRYAGVYYDAVVAGSGGNTTPGTDSTVWYALPSDLTYEIPSSYLAADLLSIHYAQSADVMTLVHPSYPPMELSRLGAQSWTLTPINFGAVVDTPQNVAVAASPGYLAQIASISEVGATGSQPAHSLIQTVSAHTLSLGDGIYITGLKNPAGTDLSNFYLVAGVPVDGDGNLITNQLWVMDYNGNTLAGLSPGYTLAPGTIQYGTKIFNITSVYAVAALDSLGVNQSVLSATASVLNNLDVPGSYNTISWSAVANSTLYYVFKQKNGLWGFIGQAMGTTLVDNNIAPDFSITPTNLTNPFSGAGNYPAAVGYIEQRRSFAGTNNAPQTIQMSNSGTDSTFAYSLPSRDTDRISVKVAAREVSSIEHIVPLASLLLLTGSCEYAEYTTNDGPITPSTIGIRPQSYIGASNVQPTVVNNSVVYCAARGGHVREMGYNIGVDGYITGDLSLRAAHLFDSLTIVDQAFSKAPLPIVWFVSSNGWLLGLTYVPEQQIGAWHHHVTSGNFESVCCVSEGNEDFLYAVVNRTINGQTVRFVERMASRTVTTLPDCFFVDAGVTFNNGTPATTISGLTWLEGCTVAVLADGAVQSLKVVTAGAITLDEAATVVQIGLPYISGLQTLPMALQVDGFGQGRQKNLNKAWVRVYQSSGIQAGPDANNLVEFKQGSMEYGTPPALVTDEAEIVLTPQWNDNGQVLIQQVNPLPLTVVDVTLEVSIGG